MHVAVCANLQIFALNVEISIVKIFSWLFKAVKIEFVKFFVHQINIVKYVHNK